VCHDFEDAAHVGIVSFDDLPELVRERCGSTRRSQLDAFISAVVDTTTSTGVVGMSEPMADALAAFRRFNYDHIYMRPESVAQASLVIDVLRNLVEYYADLPDPLPLEEFGPRSRIERPAGSPEALHEAVTYVGGMTDRYAFTHAVTLLGWDRDRLPLGIDLRGLV
jgi:dGTPase